MTDPSPSVAKRPLTPGTEDRYRRPCMRRRRCAACGKIRRCPYRGRCGSCYRGYVRPHEGPCLGGCGRDATGTRAGYCKPCYMALWRRSRLFRQAAQTDLAIMAVSAALAREVAPQSRLGTVALRAARALIDGVLTGRVVIHLNRQRNARALAVVTEA